MRGVAVFEGQGIARVSIDASLRADLCGMGITAISGCPDSGSMVVEVRDLPPGEVQQLLVGIQIANVVREQRRGFRATIALGHSLGEICSAFLSGVLTLSESLKLAEMRGELPAMLIGDGPWGMAAVTGANLESIIEYTNSHSVEVACLNGPLDFVLSGLLDDVSRVSESLASNGLMARALPVSAPYHTRWMAAVQQSIKEFLEGLRPHAPTIPVVSPTRAAILTTASDVLASLSESLVQPVRWSESLRLVHKDWPVPFVDFGPGAILTRYVSRNDLQEIDWRPLSEIPTSPNFLD